MHFSILISILFSTIVMASGGGGESAAPAEAKKKDFSRDEAYSVVNARVATLQTKVSAIEQEIKALITERSNPSSADRLKQIQSELKEKHHEYKEAVEEYNQARNQVQLRFPEQLAENEDSQNKNQKKAEAHAHPPMKALSIDEIGDRLTLGGAIQSTIKKIQRTYLKKVPASLSDTKKINVQQTKPKDGSNQDASKEGEPIQHLKAPKISQ